MVRGDRHGTSIIDFRVTSRLGGIGRIRDQQAGDREIPAKVAARAVSSHHSHKDRYSRDLAGRGAVCRTGRRRTGDHPFSSDDHAGIGRVVVGAGAAGTACHGSRSPGDPAA